jgi:hypothetical protein
VVDDIGRINLVGKRQELGKLAGAKTIEDNLRGCCPVVNTDLMVAAPFKRKPLCCCVSRAVALRR